MYPYEILGCLWLPNPDGCYHPWVVILSAAHDITIMPRCVQALSGFRQLTYFYMAQTISCHASVSSSDSWDQTVLLGTSLPSSRSWDHIFHGVHSMTWRFDLKGSHLPSLTYGPTPVDLWTRSNGMIVELHCYGNSIATQLRIGSMQYLVTVHLWIR